MLHSSVVVDKSFLQARTKEAVHQFASQHRILMTEALFFEMLTNPQDRRACFAKLPAGENPVDLVLHIGAYFKKEVSTRRQTPQPSTKLRKLRFQFNDRLLLPDYILPSEAKTVVDQQRRDVIADAQSAKSRALQMPSFFPDLASRKNHIRRAARDDAETQVVKPGALMDFYASLRSPKGQRKLPPMRLITEEWALYRWLQIDFLFCIDLYFRFGSTLSNHLSPKAEQGIEHDTLDAQYLLVGVLEGSFATHESKLQRWFKLILPHGQLFTKDA
jgi:hypothetical protein